MNAIAASSTSFSPATAALNHGSPYSYQTPTPYQDKTFRGSLKINGLFRQCNGPCERKLLYDSRNQADVITHRCPVCMCDTQWMRVTV